MSSAVGSANKWMKTSSASHSASLPAAFGSLLSVWRRHTLCGSSPLLVQVCAKHRSADLALRHFSPCEPVHCRDNPSRGHQQCEVITQWLFGWDNNAVTVLIMQSSERIAWCRNMQWWLMKPGELDALLRLQATQRKQFAILDKPHSFVSYPQVTNRKSHQCTFLNNEKYVTYIWFQLLKLIL